MKSCLLETVSRGISTKLGRARDIYFAPVKCQEFKYETSRYQLFEYRARELNFGPAIIKKYYFFTKSFYPLESVFKMSLTTSFGVFGYKYPSKMCLNI